MQKLFPIGAVATFFIVIVVAIALTFYSYSQKEIDIQHGRTLVLYFAPWCKYCIEFKPTWDTLKSRMEGEINFQEINGSENPEIMKKMNVRGFPSIVIYKDGEEVSRYKGTRSIDSLVEFIKLN